MKSAALTIAVVLLTLSGVGIWESEVFAEERDQLQIGELDWHVDYFTAYREAQAEKRLLFIVFRDPNQEASSESFRRTVLAGSELKESLGKFVRLSLPIDAELPATEKKDSPTKLLDHVAFKHMEHRAGIAVMDLMDNYLGQYGKLISAHPFTNGKHYTIAATGTVLTLPRASVTQRALIYAIRIHPESPRSTACAIDPHLLKETRKHSRVMANLEQVGHHDWGRRFQELTAKYGQQIDVSEVAAVSWGGESLIEGAKDCVAAWRQSPGHWAGVSGVHLFYGYDLVRGASGKWYATGLFATKPNK